MMVTRWAPFAGMASRRCHWLLWVLIGLTGGLATPGCGMPEAETRGQGPGHRAQPLALTPEQELELGRRAYAQVLTEYRGRILPPDRPEVRRVRHIVARIVRAAGIRPLLQEINLHLQGDRFEWEANVIRLDQINAFALPGGKMVVFTGILPVAENDDQLATVLAHEISHVLAHHASERVAREQSGVAGLLHRRAYDRSQESEADKIGLFLMTFANYDPAEAVRFWQRMQHLSENRGRLPELLSDHPSDARRVHDLQALVPRVLAAKKAYEEGWIAPERGR